MNQADPLRKSFGHIENLRGIQDRPPTACGFTGMALERINSLRVHAGGKRFIHQPNFTVGSQHRNQSCFVYLAA